MAHPLDTRTTLGMFCAPALAFNDQPRDYADWVEMFSRWLSGPLEIDLAWPADRQQAEKTLQWRVFGHAEPSLADLEAVGWKPNTHKGPLGLWNLQRWDTTGLPEVLHREHLDDYTHGRIPDDVLRNYFGTKPLRREELAERTLSEVWAKNIITDNGATAMLKNAWNTTGSTVAIYNHLGIAFGNQAYAIQSGASITNASGAQTSIACAGGVQITNFPANGFITWSYGQGANAETWQLGPTTPGNLAATSLTVVSQTTVAGHTHASGDYIVNNPTTSDNPSSVSNTADSGALPGGDFAFSGTGAGNRQVVISYTYSTATAAGAYTEAYTGNAATIATGTTGSHLIFPPQTINGTTSLAITITEKV